MSYRPSVIAERPEPPSPSVQLARSALAGNCRSLLPSRPFQVVRFVAGRVNPAPSPRRGNIRPGAVLSTEHREGSLESRYRPRPCVRARAGASSFAVLGSSVRLTRSSLRTIPTGSPFSGPAKGPKGDRGASQGAQAACVGRLRESNVACSSRTSCGSRGSGSERPARGIVVESRQRGGHRLVGRVPPQPRLRRPGAHLRQAARPSLPTRHVVTTCS